MSTALTALPVWVPVLWVIIWSVSLSVVDVRTRRLPTPMIRWFGAGLLVLALLEGTPALIRAVVGAGVLAGLLRLAGGVGAGVGAGAGSGMGSDTVRGIGGGDIRLAVPLGGFVGLTGATIIDAIVGSLLVAGLAAVLSLGQVVVRALVADRGSRRGSLGEPLAFGPWLCLGAVVIGLVG